MKAAHIVCAVLLLALARGAGAQQVQPITASPRVGETITIELDRPLGANESASWMVVSGQGEIVGAQNGAGVTFRATIEGRVVIMCVIRDPNGERRPAQEFFVRPGDRPTPPPSPQAAPPPQRTSAPPVSPARRPAPAEVLALKNVDLIQPAGWMGDSMVENGETARIDPNETGNCRSGPTCYRIEYDKPGRLGWTAFGLQFVPEGAPMNWGEFPGMDLNDRGFRSFRVWAKTGDTARVQFKSGGNVSPNFPKNAASYSVAGPTVQLTKVYVEFCLDLSGRSLRNVVSPLTVVLTRAANPKGAVVFVDDASFSTNPCQAQ